MSITISIRFLTGRAHLHPWQTHHSEGRVEWPPSPWRLLRALVAVAGRGLTSLSFPDFVVDPGKKPKPTQSTPNPSWPSEGYESLPDSWSGGSADEIPLSRLAALLQALSATPTIWLPKTAGGHTRQYFPIHSGGIVRPTGSAVFDTFVTVRKDHPLLFHWPALDLADQHLADLNILLNRMTYFGRAESWCRAEAHANPPEEIGGEGISEVVLGQTHWECLCIEDSEKPTGQEYRDYLLERRLAPIAKLKEDAANLLPRTNTSEGKKRKVAHADVLKTLLAAESTETLLLRCLLRESGQDIKDGLERPIGTRWVHYAVPRAIYNVRRGKPQPRPRAAETVDLVRYALNTATVGRAVLPAVTDTLLVADKFRSAVMALCRHPSAALSGHEQEGSPCKDHQHAFWWPVDEDNDGFIDHVIVWAPAGFEQRDVDALRRLTRLRQRGGRPDLLVTPIFVGLESNYDAWHSESQSFVSATPYFPSVRLGRGKRSRSSRPHSLKKIIRKRLCQQRIIDEPTDVNMCELVFDYDSGELATLRDRLNRGICVEPIPPRQYFPVGETEPPIKYPPLPQAHEITDLNPRYRGSYVKDPDKRYTFGAVSGMLVQNATRFIRTFAFCRRRRGAQVTGVGRTLLLRFAKPIPCRPFALGNQCHFGLGLFIACDETAGGG